mmetsp:Transcript_63060/g.163796  ORF Transcript_63060/g.163796 Transcript_63060/m.163796 type:complete len:262 (-) Transcript_63060:782-1567(-)
MVPQPRGEHPVRLVGGLGVPTRPLEGRRHRQHRYNREGLLDAPSAASGYERPAQVRVHRKLSHVSPDLGELALVVHGPQEVQHLQSPHHGLWRGRLHEVKVHQVLHAQLLESNHHRAEIAPQDLGVSALGQLGLEGILGVQAETLPGPRAPCSAGPLHGAGLGDGRHEQRLDVRARVVHRLLEEARVDDVDDAVDRERGLRDVRGNDHLALALRSWREHPPLLLHRQRRVQRQHHEVTPLAELVLELGTGRLYLLLATQEQ